VSYYIFKTDGALLTTITDGTINTTSTSIGLPGRLYPGYGQVVDTNFVQIIENFADANVPNNPLQGQIWYNTADNSLYVCPSDGETNPAAWYKLFYVEQDGSATFGNIDANNISVANALDANSITANYVTVNVQANVANANVTGNLLAGNVYANAGTIGASLLTGTLTTASQPNITTVGTLSSLTVTNKVTAGQLQGDGGNISNIQAANLSGTVASATEATNAAALLQNVSSATTAYPTFSPSSANGNSQSLVNPNISANLSNASITATTFVGNLSGNATTAGTVTVGPQPNITGLGTLNSLAVNGGVSATNFISNVATGTSPLSVLSTTKVDNLNADLLDGFNAAVVATADTVAVRDNSGNINANYFIGNGSQLTGLDTSTISNGVSNVSVSSVNGNVEVAIGGLANLARFTSTGLSVTGNVSTGNVTATRLTGSLTTAAQPNITSVGTLSSLNVTGKVTAGQLQGDGGNIGNIQGSSVSGAVPNATHAANATFATTAGTAGTVTTSGQPNITSLGTLVGLTVGGVTNLGSLGNVKISGGSPGYVISTDGAGTLSWISTGSADTAQTVTNNAQPNITSVGTLTSLNVSGPANLGFVANVKITGGTNGYVLSTDGTGNLSWISTSAATTAQYVTQNNQSNITSVGTLTSLNVAGTANLGNVANVKIGGGSAGYNLTTDGAGNLTWTPSGTATTAQTVTNNAQPNITSVGTLTGLTSSGNIIAPYFIGNVVGNVSGNFAISGTNTAVVFNDAGTIGTSNAFTFNKTSNVLTVSGNVQATRIIGNGSALTSLTGANVTGTVANATFATTAGTAGTVTTAAQPNITSLGTLSQLIVTGNINAGNVIGTHYGSGLNLTNLPGANVTGAVSFASTANSVAGANVLGTVANATYALNAGNAANATFATTAANANVATRAGTVTTNAQPNITSVGTLGNLVVSGSLTVGGSPIVKLSDYESGFGWTRLPNGLLIQYGTAYATRQTYTTITYPTSFTSYSTAVASGSTQSSADGSQGSVGVTSAGASSFTVYVSTDSGGSAVFFNWIAIGY